MSRASSYEEGSDRGAFTTVAELRRSFGLLSASWLAGSPKPAVAGWSFKAIIWPWLSSMSNGGLPLREPCVFVIRDVEVGQQLTRELVEVRGDVLSVTDDRPVTVEDVIGLHAIQDLPIGTRLTPNNIGFLSSEWEERQ